MQKLLYAVNAEAIETPITASIRDNDIAAVGGVAYREALITTAQECKPDIVLYRGTLKGSRDNFDLMFELRKTCPNVRVVYISQAESVTNPFLTKLVSIGIYDVIVSDKPTLTEIIDFILHPRDFSYASRFFRAENLGDLLPPDEPPVTETSDPAPKGLFGFLKKTGGQGTPEEVPVAANSTKVNMESARIAMREEARRAAKKEVDALVEERVKLRTSELYAQLETKEREFSQLTSKLQEQSLLERDLRSQIDELSSVASSQKDNASLLSQDSDILRAEVEAVRLSMQEQLNARDSTCNSLRIQLSTKDALISELQERLSGMTNGVSHSSETSFCNSDWLTEKQGFEARLAESHAEISGLKAQLAQSEALASGFRQKAETGEAMAAQFKAALDEKTRELEEQSKRLKAAEESAEGQRGNSLRPVDYEGVADCEDVYQYRKSGAGQILSFVGARPGVGNTSVAFNTAVSLASNGYKVCYIELDTAFPSVAELLGLKEIGFGIDACIKAIGKDEPVMASRCILKSANLESRKRGLTSSRMKLPESLHFLLHSDEYLIRCKVGNAPVLQPADYRTLFRFLIDDAQYSFVIIDQQPGDQTTLKPLLLSQSPVDRLFVTLTQDVLSINAANALASELMHGDHSSLIKEAEFIVNQFLDGGKKSLSKISGDLHVPGNKLIKVALDTKGYMDAGFHEIPYVLLKGAVCDDYSTIVRKISG